MCLDPAAANCSIVGAFWLLHILLDLGRGEWFGIYVRQAHTPKIPIKFVNQSYTELNVKKSTLHASYLRICISVYRILICRTMYILHNRSFWVETDHNILSMIGLLMST